MQRLRTRLTALSEPSNRFNFNVAILGSGSANRSGGRFTDGRDRAGGWSLPDRSGRQEEAEGRTVTGLAGGFDSVAVGFDGVLDDGEAELN